MGIAYALHVLSAVVWVGGMFFAYVLLRPVLAAAVDARTRATIWAQVLHRFFGWVFLAMALLLGTGLHQIRALGGFGNVGPHVHAMFGIGLFMMLLALHVYFAPLRRLKQAVQADNIPEAGKRIGQIRRYVGINLTLGLIVVAIAAGGRWIHF